MVAPFSAAATGSSRCLLSSSASATSLASVSRPSSCFRMQSLSSSLASSSVPSSPSTSIISNRGPSSRRSFSSSSLLCESRKERSARLKKKNNLDLRILKTRMLDASKPDPVLGHQLTPAGQKVWSESELAKIILTKKDVWGVELDRRGNLVSINSDSNKDPSSSSSQSSSSTNLLDRQYEKDAKQYGGPVRLNFGLNASPADRELLFKDLPQVMVKDRILDSWNLGTLIRGTANANDIDAFTKEYSKVQEEEQENKQSLARILDLRNASGKGIQVENIRRIVEHFGTIAKEVPVNDPDSATKASKVKIQLKAGVDTGSPEVQAAILTYRIRNLYEHLEQNHRHDNSNRRSMAKLVQKRGKILKYLRRTNPARYQSILPRIGIEPRAVEGEITTPGKPKVSHI